ncbi:MAG: HAD family hydrolase [Sedimentisphaerales bacterium]|nr:HAD family hydrolase [Sedimentisphaerales bacterium]
MSQVRALLFDFGGTLDNDGEHWFARLYRLMTKQGCGLDWEVFAEHADLVARSLENFADTATLLMGDLVQRICEQLHERLLAVEGNGGVGWQPTEIAGLFMAESEQYLSRNKDVLRDLGKRYRLGCISNNWGNTAGWCAEFGLDKYFETMIDSTVVGAAKPDRKIFDAALTDMGLAADDCAYVGDWFGADMVGGRGVGMKTVWLDDGAKNCPDESMVDYRIKSLLDLAALEWG